MNAKKTVVMCACLTLLAMGAALRGEDKLAPFVLPWDDGSAGPTSLAGLSATPAGGEGFIHTGTGGHLYVGHDAAEHRIRLMGVNITFGGAAPDHATAEKVAARLAKFGVNCIRFHHMDSVRAPNGLIAPGKTTRHLDADALDRFDYFVAQLESRGIYADINLQVGRRFTPADGLPDAIDHIASSYARKSLSTYYAPLIKLQKEYAHELLGHVNPYTHKRYADDPGVGIVEILNESGLMQGWLSGDLDALPQVFRDDLQRQWNEWLKAKYGTTDKLAKAWGVVDEPLGKEMLTESNWGLEQHDGAKASVKKIDDGNGVQITVTKPGTASWHVQWHNQYLDVKVGQVYTLTFEAKADRDRTVDLELGMAHDPWNTLGFNADVSLSTQWQTFMMPLRVDQSDDHARLEFTGLGLDKGSVSLKNVSLKPGGKLGLPHGETLEAGTIGAMHHGYDRHATPAASRDWMTFLWQTEHHYWQTMRDCVKKELGYKGVVVGTIVGCTTPNMMADFDAIDTHAYWHHPSFPGRPWDPANWYVVNESMVNTPAKTLARLGIAHVAGKPMMSTEYNHPAPNTYASEAPLMLASFASAQDFDAIFMYSYHNSASDWGVRRINGYFAINQNPTKMANLMLAAAMFRRFDVPRFAEVSHFPLTVDQELDVLTRQGQAWRLCDARTLGVDPEVMMHKRFELTVPGVTVPASDESSADAKANEVNFDRSRPGKGVMTVDSPHTRLMCGFVDGRSFKLGDVTITPGKTRQDWCTIGVTLMHGQSFTSGPADAVIVATGYTENTDMGWKNPQHTTVGRDWGKAPSLVEVIPAAITLPANADRVAAWALDEQGHRAGEIPVTADGAGHAVVHIGKPAMTLWYEVQIR